LHFGKRIPQTTETCFSSPNLSSCHTEIRFPALKHVLGERAKPSSDLLHLLLFWHSKTTKMALPVVPHRLTKIRAENRVRLVRSAFLFTICAVIANVFSVCTNEWLHTSEVLKYFVFPNRTADEEQNPPTYFKVSREFGFWKRIALYPNLAL
jgi:hypothetical protein